MMSADKSEVMLADTPGQESMSLMILFAKRKVNGRSVKYMNTPLSIVTKFKRLLVERSP